jgi:hypothetical protein
MLTPTTVGAVWPARAAYFSAAIFTAASGGTNLIYGWQKGGDLASSLVWADLGCAAYVYKPMLGVPVRHGRAPLSVTAHHARGSGDTSACSPFTLSWGDGKTENFSDPSGFCPSEYRSPRTHTYTSPGAYTLTLTRGGLNAVANIRIDGPVTLAPNQTQLASALVALQSALQALLQLLK